MSEHTHGHKGHASHHKSKPPRGVHKGWVAIVAVILMIAAMGGYILTLDESLEPAGDLPAEPMPAAE